MGQLILFPGLSQNFPAAGGLQREKGKEYDI
jgi:hypothetical protein